MSNLKIKDLKLKKEFKFVNAKGKTVKGDYFDFDNEFFKAQNGRIDERALKVINEQAVVYKKVFDVSKLSYTEFDNRQEMLDNEIDFENSYELKCGFCFSLQEFNLCRWR